MPFDFRCRYSPTLSLAITGSSGFIGRGVIGVSGCHDFQQAELTDLPDELIVLHLAAAISNSLDALAGNIQRDALLIAQVQARHAGIIYASTNNVYPYAIDCHVGDGLRCNDYYSASKVVGEKLVQDMLGKPFCIVRIADVFGVGQRHGNLFRAIERAISGQTALKKYGLGLKRRSYIYEPELSSLLVHLAQCMANNLVVPSVINACYDESPTVAELIATVASLTQLPVEEVEVAGDKSFLDIRTMRAGPFGTYRSRWPSLTKAVEDYIQRCRDCRAES